MAAPVGASGSGSVVEGSPPRSPRLRPALRSALLTYAVVTAVLAGPWPAYLWPAPESVLAVADAVGDRRWILLLAWVLWQADVFCSWKGAAIVLAAWVLDEVISRFPGLGLYGVGNALAAAMVAVVLCQQHPVRRVRRK